MESQATSFTQRIVEVFLRNSLSPLIILVALLLGAGALLVTPREEEPQIVVPMADVFIQVPGATAQEVEQHVATPLEKILMQIDGVEYVYSASRPGQAVVTVRFYVGEERENSLVKIYNKIESNIDQVPANVAGWVVKPMEIDDVPIVNVTLWSERPELYDDAALRRMAEEIETDLQSIDNTNRVEVYGGRPRQVRVEMDPEAMAAHGVTPLALANAIQAADFQLQAGAFDQQNSSWKVEAGRWIEQVREVGELVVTVADNRPVYLKNVARILDGPAEVQSYTWIGFGPRADDEPRSGFYPAVHVAIAKKRGSNAVWVARDVKQRLERYRNELLPEGVHARITRDYGQTANSKVNELVSSLAIAILIVIALIAITLGFKEALIIAVAVPITFALTLTANYLFGFTINRVTLFALILCLGLVVDDSIVDVENIYRHFKMRKEPPLKAVLSAVQEVRPPVILASSAVILSFLPLFFITGMMGPYMRPMAFNLPTAMIMSLFVEFAITPWMAWKIMRPSQAEIERANTEEQAFDLEKTRIYKAYSAILRPFLARPFLGYALLALTIGLLGLAMLLGGLRLVPLKMLPYDNKNEFQIVVDMDEGTTLETTDATLRDLADVLRTVPEVQDFTLYSGIASPMDFNGMVRQYYLRRGPHVGDIRVNLNDKKQREHQSHEIVLRIRDQLEAVAREHQANIKLVEMPPGPPVVATITAEIRGEPGAEYPRLISAAHTLADRMRAEPLVVDVDTSAEADQQKWVFQTDKEKAALSGITTEQIARSIAMALQGHEAAQVHIPTEADPLRILLRMPREGRSAIEDLQSLPIAAADGTIVPISTMGQWQLQTEDKTILHKNLDRIVYVFAEVAGRTPADAIIDMIADRGREAPDQPRPVQGRTFFHNGGGIGWQVPDDIDIQWAGEGEWQITLDVFRDLGLAFAAACIGIYFLLVYQTGSYFMPLILMISIPLTIIGIMPGFWLLNLLTNESLGAGGYPNPVFFTATAMIGMIALSGIAVRNAILLIEFVHESLRKDVPLLDALLQSGATRFRPIFLTAGTAMLAAWPITLDPIFSGLAWALIFGLFVSTAFTLLVIPIVYHLVYKNHPTHGLPQTMQDDA